ncbi:unnamed protein product [Discosporangium mesarthrocarpum]
MSVSPVGPSTPLVGLEPVSVLSALWESFKPPAPSLKQPKTLCNIVLWGLKQSRPVVVVPEGARTNGSGVILFSRVFDSLEEVPAGSGDGGDKTRRKGSQSSSLSTTFGPLAPPQVHVAAFSYHRAGAWGVRGRGLGAGAYTPAQPVGSMVQQLFWLCSQLSMSVMDVSYVSSTDSPPFPLREASHGGSGQQGNREAGTRSIRSPQQTIGTWTDEMRSLLAAMLGKPKLAVGSLDFVSFVEYWGMLQRGDKAGAAGLADKRKKN